MRNVEGGGERPLENLGGEETSEIGPLAPEVVERVMQRVEDIDTYGTFYTTVSRRPEDNEISSIVFQEAPPRATEEELEAGFDSVKQRFLISRFEGVLKDGVLGTWELFQGKHKKITKEDWAGQLRKHSPAHVYFNIVGRTVDSYPGTDPEIGRSCWVHTNQQTTITLLLDSDPFTEVDPDQERLQSREFQLNNDRDKEDKERLKKLQNKVKPRPGKSNFWKERDQREKINEKGERIADGDFGFRLAHRLPPRFFRGVVLAKGNDRDLSDVIRVMQQTNKENPEDMLPVYNEHGDLLWPERKSYEEVKELVVKGQE